MGASYREAGGGLTMGRRGPAPTPTALKLLRGNPGRRPLNNDEPKPDVIKGDERLAKPPTFLSADAKLCWKRVAPSLIQLGLLTVADVSAFEAYCEAYARWRQYERLTGKNLELAISKGYRNHAVRERQLMLQYGARFGLDPSSRTNIKTPKIEKPESRVDKFRARKAGA